MDDRGSTDVVVARLAGQLRAPHGGEVPVILVFGSAGEGVARAQAITGAAVIDDELIAGDADAAAAPDPVRLRFEIAAAVAGARRMVVVLADEQTDADAAAEAVRRRCPLFVVSDSADGAVQLARGIAWELQDEPVLKRAWRTFATYDAHATALRATFENFQKWILGLGIAATFLALLSNAVQGDPDHVSGGEDLLHWAVVAGPIVVAVLIALANRRAAGKRWVLLRAGAESVKGQIYRYRTRRERDPAALAKRLDEIESRLMQSEASGGPLTPYSGALPPVMYGAEAEDDGLSQLDGDQYLQIRVADQLRYYHGKVKELDRLRNRLQVVGVAAGGAGAILAAAGAEIWIGLTTAVSGAALSYLGYLQVDNAIVTYNQSAAQLEALQRGWDALKQQGWDALTPEQRAERFEQCVTMTEGVLTAELGGWVQQMNSAMEEQADQGKKGDAEAV